MITLWQDRVLCALAFGELRQCLSSNQLLKMRCLLMRRERSFILENLIEEELCRLGARTVDHEALNARFFARMRCKAGQDCRHGLFLTRTGLPEGRYNKAVRGVV